MPLLYYLIKHRLCLPKPVFLDTHLVYLSFIALKTNGKRHRLMMHNIGFKQCVLLKEILPYPFNFNWYRFWARADVEEDGASTEAFCVSATSLTLISSVSTFRISIDNRSWTFLRLACLSSWFSSSTSARS